MTKERLVSRRMGDVRKEPAVLRSPMGKLTDYVVHGRIGPVSCGMSKSDVAVAAGVPANWVGKPPRIGAKHESYGKASVWLYFHDSVGVRFDDEGNCVSLLVYPDKFKHCPEIFAGWDLPTMPTMGQWKETLRENDIAFREATADTEDYWILAVETCLARSLPYSKGKKIDRMDRPVLIIEKFASNAHLELEGMD